MPDAEVDHAQQRARIAREVGIRISTQRHSVIGDNGKPLTQEQLSYLVGLDRAYLGRVERGEVNLTLYNLVRIAAKLNVDPSVLVEGLAPT